MQEALNIVGVDVHFRVTELMEQQDAQSVLLLVDELMSGGFDLRDFLSGLLEHLRNLLIARVTGQTDLIEASDVTRKRYSETAAKFSVSDLLRAQRLVHGTDQAMRFTAQSRFRLEADMVQLVTMPRAVDLAGLIDGIEEMKKGGIVPAAAPAPRPAQPAARPAQAATPLARPAQAAAPAASAPAPRFAPSATSRASSVSAQESAAKPSAPAPLPPGQGRTVNEDEVRSRWAEFTTEVKNRKMALGSTIAGTTLIGVTNGIIRVACEDDFQISSIQMNRDALNEIIQSIFSARGTLQGEPASGSGGQPVKEDHPLVKTLKRELGAEPM